MASAYLILNAALYLVLAVVCTASPETTATSLGLTLADASGRAEFLVVYGGLQLGLAAAFALAAFRPGLRRVGCQLGVILYGCACAYRAAAFLWIDGLRPVSTTLLMVELILLALAVVALRLSPPQPARAASSRE